MPVSVRLKNAKGYVRWMKQAGRRAAEGMSNSAWFKGEGGGDTWGIAAAPGGYGWYCTWVWTELPLLSWT
jgi:hypothetical protein